MAKKIYYEKKGRRYVPFSEYDSDYLDSFTRGNHLVMVYPGGTSRRYNIDPAYAPMIAAGRVAENAISEVIRKATDLRMKPRATPLTPKQKKAWDNLIKEMGEEARSLEWPSAREAAERAVEAMQAEADKLLANPAVRKSYDHFMLVCQLTKETNEVQPR